MYDNMFIHKRNGNTLEFTKKKKVIIYKPSMTTIRYLFTFKTQNTLHSYIVHIMWNCGKYIMEVWNVDRTTYPDSGHTIKNTCLIYSSKFFRILTIFCSIKNYKNVFSVIHYNVIAFEKTFHVSNK